MDPQDGGNVPIGMARWEQGAAGVEVCIVLHCRWDLAPWIDPRDRPLVSIAGWKTVDHSRVCFQKPRLGTIVKKAIQKRPPSSLAEAVEDRRRRLRSH